MTTLAIVGSRHFTDAARFRAIIHPSMLEIMPDHIVSGGQSGVDTLAREYATVRNIPFLEFPESAQLGSFSARCHQRNQKIADVADFLLALPCEHSRGTCDTVTRFERKGRKATVVIVECGNCGTLSPEHMRGCRG